MANQPITGYPSSWRAPFTAAEILFAQGASTAGSGPRDALYCAPLTSAGAWTPGTVYEVKSERDAIVGAGPGSPLHRAIRKHLQANKTGRVFALPYAASSGAGVASATGTITVTGPATKSGQLLVTVCDEDFSVSYRATDTADDIGAVLAAMINARTHLPVTASNTTGVVTLTAKVAGASQGDGTVGVIRFRASVGAGTGVTVATSGAALGLGGGTSGADGAVAEKANLAAALANIEARRFYYMGFSVWSAGDVAAVKAHVSLVSEPRPGLRCRAFTGYTGTLSGCQTIAIGVNYERHHIAWQKNSDHDVAELVANTLAIHQKYEELDTATNFDGYRQGDWRIRPAASDADWPDEDDINDAITDGIIPIASDQTGSFLVMSINTRSKDETGALDDFRACETHRVAVMDEFVDTILTRHRARYANFKLRDDQKLPDGSVNFNQRIPPRVLTPSMYRPWFYDQIDEFVTAGKLQGADDWKQSTAINIDPQNVSRLEVGTSGRTIDLLHQTTFRIAETTPA